MTTKWLPEPRKLAAQLSGPLKESGRGSRLSGRRSQANRDGSDAVSEKKSSVLPGFFCARKSTEGALLVEYSGGNGSLALSEKRWAYFKDEVLQRAAHDVSDADYKATGQLVHKLPAARHEVLGRLVVNLFRTSAPAKKHSPWWEGPDFRHHIPNDY